MARLSIVSATHGFRTGGREIRAVDGVSLELRDGEIVAVVGPSGSGKTTLLRIASGLLEPDSGTARLEPGTRIGFMFQEPRLLGHLTAEGNIALGLGARRARRCGASRVGEVIELLGLGDHRRAYPSELSGGLAQRVALGRALVRDPDLIFMDEPFSALDAILRRRLQDDLLDILARRGTSALFVTHDLAEALYLGDRAVVLRAGRIVRDETIPLPRPRDSRAAEFSALQDSIARALGGELPHEGGLEYESSPKEHSA